MLSINIRSPLVIILGPTAVGKTDLSINLAKAFNGEIISADSRYLYRGMDIGTAKPTPQEKARVPHHLIDVADPDEVWSLALYQSEINRVIEDIHTRGKLPFLVGGTGQYIRAIIEGWNIPPQAPDPRMREVLSAWGEKLGAENLYQKLVLIDPVAAANIEPNNIRRTIRAFEVLFLTGERFSDLRSRQKCPYSVLQIGLRRDRAELYQRIDARIENMVTEGLLDETKKLLEKGYSVDLPSLSAIGYREMVSVLQRQITLDEALVLMKRYTRIFVRRQANWFKENDPKIHWFDMQENVLNAIIEFINSEKGWIPPGE